MGQEEVIKVLKKNGDWMIAGEIASNLEVNRDTVNRALKTLYKHSEVMRKVVKRRKLKGTYLWKYK